MKGFIKLTAYESGKPVLLRIDTIRAIAELPAFNDPDTGQEEGARTRVDDDLGHVWLVQESANEIEKLTTPTESRAK